MNQFILVLCGLPASGKSTLADVIKNALITSVEIVRTDEWRDDLYYIDWTPEKEGVVRQRAIERVKQLVTEGKSVIHDDVNYYESMRHQLFRIAVQNRCGFAIIHITTSVTTSLKWNRERADTRIPDSVIENIAERFDTPGRHYLWDKAQLEVDLEIQEPECVLVDIIEILEELRPARQIKPKPSTNKRFERLDAETRSVVSQFLEEHSTLRSNKQVSIIRRDFLRTASERKIPLKQIHRLLWRELSELL